MDYLFQDGGEPKKTMSKTGSKTKSSSKTGTKSRTKTATKTKTSTKTGTKTTKSKTSSKKGGNFLGAVGDLVAPTGWGPFATAAGLLALDRADAALRRGKSTKSSAKKGGEPDQKNSVIQILKSQSQRSNNSNALGASKLRGNNPNTRQQTLDKILAQKEEEQTFGTPAEFQNFPKKNREKRESNLLSNSKGASKLRGNILNTRQQTLDKI
jgi:hypothetical protein